MDYTPVVALVSEILHRKDPYNHHGLNVGILTVKVARNLTPTLDEEHVKMLEIGANLHDMGKMLLEDALLNLPRPLTAGEYEVVKTHTTRGFQIASTLQYDPIIRDIIHYHHENMDGSGYPRGLKGEEIPLYARIVRVVDTFDSMTNHRAYRRADSRQSAMTLLEGEAGRIFDAGIVRILKDVLEKKD